MFTKVECGFNGVVFRRTLIYFPNRLNEKPFYWSYVISCFISHLHRIRSQNITSWGLLRVKASLWPINPIICKISTEFICNCSKMYCVTFLKSYTNNRNEWLKQFSIHIRLTVESRSVSVVTWTTCRSCTLPSWTVNKEAGIRTCIAYYLTTASCGLFVAGFSTTNHSQSSHMGERAELASKVWLWFRNNIISKQFSYDC